MKYIVRTFNLGCDEVWCEDEDVACEMARKIRNSGHFAVVIDGDAPEVCWLVSGDGVEDVHVAARSADEAICIAQVNTGRSAYNTVQLEAQIQVVVTRPDGDIDVIECICIDEAKKYLRRYNDRGWRAVLKLV